VLTLGPSKNLLTTLLQSLCWSLSSRRFAIALPTCTVCHHCGCFYRTSWAFIDWVSSRAIERVAFTSWSIHSAELRSQLQNGLTHYDNILYDTLTAAEIRSYFGISKTYNSYNLLYSHSKMQLSSQSCHNLLWDPCPYICIPMYIASFPEYNPSSSSSIMSQVDLTLRIYISHQSSYLQSFLFCSDTPVFVVPVVPSYISPYPVIVFSNVQNSEV